MRYTGYDIIGDVHGCASTLKQLLGKLDYMHEDDIYYHPSRQAIFVGDIVDRGPKIREALRIVKAMVDAGSAQCVMGNHEYNALGYVTPKPEQSASKPIAYVRAHNTRHNHLIFETLEQFAPYPQEWRDYLEWFKTLPVHLDMDGFRVVHACWDQTLIDRSDDHAIPSPMDQAFIQRSADRSSFEGLYMDRLTRGTDMLLPEGRVIDGKDGYHRRMFRTKFWSENPVTLGDVAFQPDPLPDDIARMRLTDEQREKLVFYHRDQPPVFIGHYWLHGEPKPLKNNVACLDYSAVKFGRLVAYRFDGEDKLHPSKFAWVNLAREEEMNSGLKLAPRRRQN